MRSSVRVLLVFACLAACGDSESGSATVPDASGAGPTDAAASVLQNDAAPPERPGVLRAVGYEPLVSFAETLAMFSDGVSGCTPLPPTPGATTYYVAANEPGADDDACDGRSPTDMGGGRCPFRSFDAPHVRALLVGTKNVRFEVRSGVYRLIPPDATAQSTDAMPFVAEGLRIVGAGASDDERVVLTNYAGEDVLFDGEGHIREVIRVSGSYTYIEGLTIVNGGGYNIELNGGSHHLVRCNRIGWTGSDSVKGDGGTTDSQVIENEFVDWSSQAIDLTEVQNVQIAHNVFHHPREADGNAIGTKFGAADVLIAHNVFHHTEGISMGGTSSEHQNPVEARRIIVGNNVFHDVRSVVAKLYSCEDCEFVDNDVTDTEGGVYFEDQSNAGPSGCPGGCGPSTGGRVADNRFRRIAPLPGGSAEGEANMFIFVATTEAAGFSAASNLYCIPTGMQARFGYGEILDFAGWQAALGADLDSSVLVDGDPLCQGW